MSACRGCRAEVYFAMTPKGKAMPLNPNPSDAGTVELRRHPSSDRPYAHVLTKDELALARQDDDRPLYVPHFATCPNADAFRKAKPKTPTPAEAAQLGGNVIPFRPRKARR